ncbi:hypothetical protein [Sphaerochaeta globosa]|uniref:Uncharacterized protein n=1 Tax=Sphaerochaeta globosa (strain ATCC BAA-1886 / DSM 22777 / Buddy) TaxID=158189 RepID=F0RWP4_SPHGB|nr:hypothetical protein [Sphaerochaeta globosa]ADY13675.1 hypothetical protein SpiBuddy_1851 [Sphaerochaeta globosa str. Buddy]
MNATTNTKTAQAIEEAKQVILAVGKVDQAAKEEGGEFAAQLKQATDALSLALTWKIGLETHIAVLKDGTVRKYIKVTKGMPRDLDVILLEGKGHTIKVKSYSRDVRHEEKGTNPLSSEQVDYNNAMDSWQAKCDKESKARLEKVLKDANTWDALWGYVALIERNNEIAKSEKYFG